MIKKRIKILILTLIIAFLVGCKVPGTDVPDTSVPDTTVPGTTIPDTTVPGTTVPGTTAPGTTVPVPQPTAPSFSISKINDALFDRMWKKSFKEDCTLSRKDLRCLHLLYTDFDGETQEGEMVVNRHIAKDVLEIFEALYDAGYPIERIRLIDEYDADDELSMEDNNSSCFNFRFITNSTKVSKHGLALAIDINPLYNPYVKNTDDGKIIEPVTATDYIDRSQDFPHKIDKNDLAYRLFTEHGFEWGGSWNSVKDYQHFEIPTDQIQEWYPENY